MTKGMFSNIRGFVAGRTNHKMTKVATLIATSAVLVAMINIDAAASPGTRLANGRLATFSSIQASGPLSSFGAFRHHGSPTTTTTAAPASPTSTTSTTSTTAPTTTTTDPAPTTTTSTTSTTSTTAPTTTTTDPAPTTTTTTPAATAYPVGTQDASEPSGYAPPSADALAGYTQSYVTDFTGSTLPSGWYTYDGQPGGDPGGQWSSSHVSVSGGLLSLNTYQDPAYNNEWVTGGLCQCGLANTYGAYFVRSRVTGAGPTQVELLWPATNTWPPEVDFNESNGSTDGSTATNIWAVSGSSRSQVQSHVGVDLTQWHTWGVIWTPDSITYTVDGRVWGEVTDSSTIPNIAMTLDIQQQTWCSSGWACPSSPQSLQVDWVAEYTPNA